MSLCDCEECLNTDNRIARIEAKLALYEEYFTAIESTLANIQKVFIAMQEGKQ